MNCPNCSTAMEASAAGHICPFCCISVKDEIEALTFRLKEWSTQVRMKLADLECSHHERLTDLRRDQQAAFGDAERIRIGATINNLNLGYAEYCQRIASTGRTVTYLDDPAHIDVIKWLARALTSNDGVIDCRGERWRIISGDMASDKADTPYTRHTFVLCPILT